MASVTELMTIEEFARMPDDGIPRELIRGDMVESNVPKPRHGICCAKAAYLIQKHLESNPIGRVSTNDSGIITGRNPDTIRGADVSFYSYERVPQGPFPSGYLEVSPNLVIEVRSESDLWSELLAKGAEYLSAGVDIVVILDPETKSARVLSPDKPFVAIDPDRALTLEPVLPEFRSHVAAFFE